MAEGTSSLPLRIRESLVKAGLDSHLSILTTSSADFRRLADLTKEDTEVTKTHSAALLIAEKFCPGFETQWQFLSAGCAELDSLLGGGFPRWGITEVAGESGTGKTQLCLQAALSVQMPVFAGGAEAGAVYICTEDSFPSMRLQQLLELWPGTKTCSPTPSAVRLSDNIYIEHVPDAESLRNCICVRLPNLLHKKRIGLVVVDSIAGAFRADEQQQGAMLRAQALRSIGHQLHLLAHAHHLAVLCVNQVTTVPGEGCSTIVPALGLAWANLVTTRLQLHRTGNFVTHPNSSTPVAKRRLEIVFCPHLENQSGHFMVTEAGIQGLNKPTI